MKNLLHRRDRTELLQRLRSLSPQSDRLWGRMSVDQMVCHLSDTFQVSLGEREATPVGNVLSHSMIKALMLYSPAEMPKGTPSTRELDQDHGGTAPQDFAGDLRKLEALLERFVAAQEDITYEHPFFGRLSRRQWGRFHYKHLDHHLRQFGA